MVSLESVFHLKAEKTTVPREVIAGLTTFFAMAYIIIVNPAILSETGMEWGAVFLATIIAAIAGTLIIGLYANVPFAQAPGMGLNTFFVYTICFVLGFTWQQALSMVFLCGILNVIMTVTSVRKQLIASIPPSLQAAIGGGIGLFVAYIGLLNVGMIDFSSGVPVLAALNQPVIWVFLIGFAVTLLLLVKQVKGALLIGIAAAAVVGIPLGVTESANVISISEAWAALPSTFGVIFTDAGLVSLFSDPMQLPLVLVTILAFGLCDMFDTIGTLVGTGRRSGIFSDEDMRMMAENRGMKSKIERSMFSDAIATMIGAVVGTSNVNTYVESATGIAAGGRTGLTSVVAACCLAASAFFASLVSAVPLAATSPILVIVGILMAASFADVAWQEFEVAAPCFFTAVGMTLCYSISYGIAAGFIVYCLIRIYKGEARAVHPLMWIFTGLFVLTFVVMALI
ncbi:MAG TPA: NCS2 family permease [Methanocorpusculum sp.]|nr:NCS2 family permease [Methanocorpusculum sp.]